MKTPFLIFVCCAFSICGLFAQQDQALEFLKAEIRRTARQRDEAQKRLLEVESRSADQMKTLSGQQVELQKKLNESSRNLLQLESNERISNTAIKRTEAELAAREKELSELRQQQTASRQEFERVTRDLSAKLAESELSGLEGTDAELVKEREQLRREIQAGNQKLAEVEAARQQDLQDLHKLQQKNTELTTALEASRRAEGLANAKLAALESRLGSLQQELTQQYQERSDLEQEQERLQGVIQDLQSRLTDAETNRVPRERLDEISAVLEQALAENQELKNDLSRRENVPDLRRDFENIRKQRDLLQAKEKTLLSKVENLEQRLDQSDAERRRLDLQNRQLEKQLKQEKSTREKMETQIADLESILKDAKAAGIREEDLEDVALLVAEIEREKEAFRQESLSHRGNVDLLQAELDRQNSTQQAQIRELQNMLGEQLREMTAAQKKIEILEVRTENLGKVKVQKENLEKLQTKSREDMRTLAKHIYELRSELIESKETRRKSVLALQKNQELAGELEKVRTELEKIRQQNASIQNQDQSREDRIRQLRIELETDRRRSKELEQEKRALLSELRELQQRLSEGSR